MKTINLISLLLALIILAAIVQLISCMVEIEASPQQAQPETFTYQLSLAGGEYVWHVARRCARPDEDIRDIVWKIEQASGLKSAGQVKPGQIIQVPVSCIDEFTVIGRVE